MLIMEACLNGNKFDDIVGSEFNTITEVEKSIDDTVLDHFALGSSKTLNAIVGISTLSTQYGG